MIELQIGKKEVVMPDKLTIRQYQKVRQIEALEKNPIKFLAVMTDLDEEDIKYAKKKDMDFVYTFLVQRYLMEQDKTLKPSFEHEGVEYGLMSDMTSLNFGGWVDLEFLTTDGVEKNMNKIMALMYRPITKKTNKGFEIEEYDHDDMEQRAEIFLDLPSEYFWGVANFFFNLVKAYTESMKASSEFQRTKEKALTRLRMINPLYHLSKLRAVFTGLALWRWLTRILPKWRK